MHPHYDQGHRTQKVCWYIPAMIEYLISSGKKRKMSVPYNTGPAGAAGRRAFLDSRTNCPFIKALYIPAFSGAKNWRSLPHEWEAVYLGLNRSLWLLHTGIFRRNPQTENKSIATAFVCPRTDYDKLFIILFISLVCEGRTKTRLGPMIYYF